MSQYAPVMLLVYNRPLHAKAVIGRLRENKLAAQTDLHIFSDAAARPEDEAAVAAVRAVLADITGFKSVSVYKAERNKNIFASTVEAANLLCRRYGRFIGLEDDIETHPLFLSYMNAALNFYKEDKRIGAVSGYAPDLAFKRALKGYERDMVFSYAFHAYGWGCWRDRWEQIDWQMPGWESYKKNRKLRAKARQLSWGHLRAAPAAAQRGSELWDIRLSYFFFQKHWLCAWPLRSYTRNIGFDGSGAHAFSFQAKRFAFTLQPKEDLVFTKQVQLSLKLSARIELAVSLLWVQSFLDNMGRLLKKPFHFLAGAWRSGSKIQ